MTVAFTAIFGAVVARRQSADGAKGGKITDTTIALKFNKPADKAGLMSAALTLASLVGTWVNVNAATQDIVKIVLTNNGGSLGVHAFGACSPTPCDWGQVPG